MSKAKKEETMSLPIIGENETVEDMSITFNIWRFSHADKLAIDKLVGMERHMVLAVDSENKDSAKVKSIDYASYMDAIRDAETEVTKIVWGIRNIDIAKIPASAFQTLIDIAREKGAFAFLAQKQQKLETVKKI